MPFRKKKTKTPLRAIDLNNPIFCVSRDSIGRLPKETLEEILQSESIKTDLKLFKCRVSTKQITRILGNRPWHSLTLSTAQIRGRNPSAFVTTIAHHTTLESLTLEWMEIKDATPLFENFSFENSSLTELNLRANPLGKETNFNNMEKSALKKLNLYKTELPEEKFWHLLLSKTLVVLDVSNNQLALTTSSLTVQNSSITRLNLADNKITDDTLGVLLNRCLGLSDLNLEQNLITEKGIAHFEGHSLKKLNLEKNSIGDKGAIALAAVCPTLIELSVSLCGIKKEGAQALMGHAGMTTLNLLGNNIGGFANALCQNTRLTHLDVTHCSLEDQDVKTLLKMTTLVSLSASLNQNAAALADTYLAENTGFLRLQLFQGQELYAEQNEKINRLTSQNKQTLKTRQSDFIKKIIYLIVAMQHNSIHVPKEIIALILLSDPYFSTFSYLLKTQEQILGVSSFILNNIQNGKEMLEMAYQQKSTLKIVEKVGKDIYGISHSSFRFFIPPNVEAIISTSNNEAESRNKSHDGRCCIA